KPRFPEMWLWAEDLVTTRELFDARHCEFEKWSSARERLRSVASDGYRNIETGLGATFGTALDRLEATPLGTTVREMQQERVTSLLGDTASSRKTLSEILDASQAVAQAFLLSTAPITITRAAELAELGLLSGAPDRPEASWIEPSGLAGAQLARDVLEPLVGS